MDVVDVDGTVDDDEDDEDESLFAAGCIGMEGTKARDCMSVLCVCDEGQKKQTNPDDDAGQKCYNAKREGKKKSF